MFGLFDSLIVFVSTLIAVIVLGVAASFSPVLYASQIAASAQKKHALQLAFGLMAGVVAALLLLMFIFQIVNIETLLRFIDTTIRAIVISVALNVLFGVFLIGLGFWYVQKKENPKDAVSATKIKRGASISALFGLGFGRTILSVSGLGATYIAGNTIAATSFIWIEQLIYTVIFLAAAVAPFFAIWILTEKGLPFLPALYDKARATIQSVNYRVTLGYGAIIFGVAVVILNIMLGLLTNFRV